MGTILIGGTAALLICVFLSPKFISFLQVREFGQNIREEGPEGHHTKAGTPTMGGIIIFTAISAPFLILSDYDWRAVGVYLAAMACAALGFADDLEVGLGDRVLEAGLLTARSRERARPARRPAARAGG